jgi:hypothetical protein
MLIDEVIVVETPLLINNLLHILYILFNQNLNFIFIFLLTFQLL